MALAIKTLSGTVVRRPNPAHRQAAVALPPVLQATWISLWGPQPQIPLNTFFRLVEVRIQSFS